MVNVEKPDFIQKNGISLEASIFTLFVFVLTQKEPKRSRRF